MHCGQSNQNFGWATAHPAYPVAPHAFADIHVFQFHDQQTFDVPVCDAKNKRIFVKGAPGKTAGFLRHLINGLWILLSSAGDEALTAFWNKLHKISRDSDISQEHWQL